MTVETDVPAPSQRADGAAAAPAPAAPPLPAGNPALLALITFLPAASRSGCGSSVTSTPPGCRAG